MSTVTVADLRLGAERSQARERALSIIDQLVRKLQPSALRMSAAEHYGHVRASLQQQGLPIGNNDLWLATHALAEGRPLVTNSAREFSRVPGLRLENGVE